MTSASLLLLLTLASVSPGGAFELPPPPPGMRALGEAEKAALLGRATAKPDFRATDEEHEPSEEIDEESAELEAMRALEQRAIDSVPAPEDQLRQSLRRLGLAHPLRQRMLDAFEEPVLREDFTPPPLPRIRNLARLDPALLEGRYDIPVEMQPLVAEYIRFFQGPGRRWFRNWMNRSTRYMPLMQEILTQHGLPRDTIYLAMIESGFSLHAYSWAHAAGPWQFIPATGKHFGLDQNYWVDERRDPVKATHAAATYLKELHGQLGHWYLAWAGYNTGAGRVRRLMKRKGTDDFWVISEGRGLMKETKHYVPKLIAAALLAKNPEAFGFRPEEFEFQEPLAFDEVQLADPTDLHVIARAAGVTEKALRELNPELKRGCTPPASDEEPYTLRLPPGTRPAFLANFERVPAHQRFTLRVHQVRPGDTLGKLARRYGAKTSAIRRLNGMSPGSALSVNSELVIPVRRRGGAKVAKSSSKKSVTKVAVARKSPPVQSPVVASAKEAASPVRSASPVSSASVLSPAPARKHAAGKVREELVQGRRRLVYEVAQGDTLWSVAQRFAVSLEELRRWNQLSPRKASLKTGTLLTVWKPRQTNVTSRSGNALLRGAESSHREASRSAH